MRRGLILLVAALAGSVCCAAEPVSVKSPDGQVRIELADDGGQLTFGVSFRGRSVIERSPMVFGVDDVQLAEDAEQGEAAYYEIDESYPWRGVHSNAINRCRGAKVEFSH